MTSAVLSPQAFDSERVQTPAPVVESISTLHELYGDRIFRFLLVSLRDRDLAQTLTQETFLRAWLARDQFRGDCAQATWLTRIALNLVRDHTRTNRFRFWRHVERTSVDAQSLAAHLPQRECSAESKLIAREQVESIWETVAELTQKQRTVFLLRFVDELELAEIAEVMSMPISTVKTHLYRALAAVRGRHRLSPKEPK